MCSLSDPLCRARGLAELGTYHKFLHFTTFNVPVLRVPKLLSLLILQSPAAATAEQYISILKRHITQLLWGLQNSYYSGGHRRL